MPKPLSLAELERRLKKKGYELLEGPDEHLKTFARVFLLTSPTELFGRFPTQFQGTTKNYSTSQRQSSNTYFYICSLRPMKRTPSGQTMSWSTDRAARSLSTSDTQPLKFASRSARPRSRAVRGLCPQ